MDTLGYIALSFLLILGVVFLLLPVWCIFFGFRKPKESKG